MWGEQNFFIMLGFEFIFLVHMGTKFLCEFVKDGAVSPTRDLKKIAERYIRTEFFLDFIPLIPFPLILTLKYGREHHFYLVKCIRLFNSFLLFDLNLINRKIRALYFNKLENIIKNDPVLA